MTLPARALQAVRPQASIGVMAGAAVVASVFAATPFLIPDVASRLSIEIGSTGLISAAQVGSFALASFLAGRLFKPRRRLHYGSLVVVAAGSLVSAVAPTFSILLIARVVSGLGLGTLTWIAWADATRFPRGMGDVAAVGPLAAALGSPVLAWLTDRGGYPWVFTALAIAALAALLLPVDFGDLPRIGRKVSNSRSNRLLLISLFTLSVGGSSVFIFTAAAAMSLDGLSPIAASWALSINAIAGVIATRQAAKRARAGVWLIGTALSALAVGTVGSTWVFFIAMAMWGFAFWMAIPAIFRLLAERSHHRAERVGDAQAAMAMGRVFGPVLGALTLGVGHFGRLSVIGAGVMVVAAIAVAGVELARDRMPTAGTSEPVV